MYKRVGNKILQFKEEYSFLSNFEPCRIIMDGIEYPSVENAYQAAKVNIPGNIILTNIIRMENNFNTCTAKQSKKQGRKVKLREDFDEVKDDIMYELVYQKFASNAELKDKLLSTGDMEIFEGNYWHDNYWGYCYCDKCRGVDSKNKLGKILMRVREELK